MIEIIKEGMCAKPSNYYIFDGFPISMQQCADFEKHIKEPDLVLLLDTISNLAEKRLLKRGKSSSK